MCSFWELSGLNGRKLAAEHSLWMVLSSWIPYPVHQSPDFVTSWAVSLASFSQKPFLGIVEIKEGLQDGELGWQINLFRGREVFDRGSFHVFVHFVILITVCELLLCTLKSAFTCLFSSTPSKYALTLALGGITCRNNNFKLIKWPRSHFEDSQFWETIFWDFIHVLLLLICLYNQYVRHLEYFWVHFCRSILSSHILPSSILSFFPPLPICSCPHRGLRYRMRYRFWKTIDLNQGLTVSGSGPSILVFIAVTFFSFFSTYLAKEPFVFGQETTTVLHCYI